MTKGTIRIMHQGVPYKETIIQRKYDANLEIVKETTEISHDSTPKIDKECATTLDKVLKKLNKKNIKIVSTDATDTHTIINYEVY